jgi:hypothetical protein
MKLAAISILLGCLVLVSVTANAQTIYKKPLQAAQDLYAAWQKKNKTLARRAASDSAVEKLFGVKPRPMNFAGCAKREEGDYECLYQDRKNDLTVAMLVAGGRRGYSVKSLSFSSEAY